jgi:regulator of replication initiation timing
MLALAAVGVLAVPGGLLSLLFLPSLLTGGPPVLRLGLGLGCATAVILAVVLVGLLWRRDRRHARLLAVEASGRRRDGSLFRERLDALHATLAAVQEQLRELRAESGELRREMASLRAEKESLRAETTRLRSETTRLRSERDEALARLRTPAGSTAREVLTADAFAAAAEVLDAFEAGEEDWVSSWVSGLFDDEGDLVIDLTMHDDTQPLALEAARTA